MIFINKNLNKNKMLNNNNNKIFYGKSPQHHQNLDLNLIKQ